MDLTHLSAKDIAAKIDAGETSCEAVTRALLDRIAEREPAVDAWEYLDPDKALADARAIDALPSKGLIHGVPLGVKDIIDTKDMPTRHGSPIHANNQPCTDAPCVTLVRGAGGLTLGKTVTSEFASQHAGKTKNPHNPAHSPAGSSSGSAAAVADFMVPVAFGTQTGGSIVRPGAFCGCIGYKPSYGDYNPLGVHDNTRSVDTLGMMSRTMDDQALLRAVLTGAPYRPIQPPAIGDLRIGLCRTPNWHLADAPTQACLEGAARDLSAAGATVTDFDLPDGFEAAMEGFDAVSGYEYSRTLSYEWINYPELLSENLRGNRVPNGLKVTAAAYQSGLAALGDYRKRYAAALQDWDVLITPSAPGEAPADLTTIGEPPFNRIWTGLYGPAINLPLFTGPQGLPIGLQVIGHLGQDDRFLDAADAVYRALR
ncbi:MAG: amidase [Alphaproteobacteria bacterium]|nr:amidase [Alphaproteobacteria bacterium]